MSEGWLLAGADEDDIATWPAPAPSHSAAPGSETASHIGAAAAALSDLAGFPQVADPVSDTFWRTEAACQSTSPDLFFPVGVTGTALVEIAAAKFVCSQCTVREPCLDYALATSQEYGIWGGFSEEDRRVIRRRRRQAGGRGANVTTTVPPGDAG